MNSLKRLPFVFPGSLWCWTLALSLTLGQAATAQTVQHLSTTQPGGMPGIPLITGVHQGSNSMTITWDGPAGYYQLFAKPSSNATWRALTGPYNLSRKATISLRYSNAQFKVTGPKPNYVGAQRCLECHSKITASESHASHAGAFTNRFFVASGGQTNSACLPCHTVGYGLPTGFTNLAKTPHLTGVQCENCHGPSGPHAANPENRAVIPRVELAATVCGGCHTDAHHPTYDEWATSGHMAVTEDMNATNRINSCGRCHSGSVRSRLIQGKRLPVGDANMGVVCVTCHNAHQNTNNPAQLRNPTSSTNDYFLTTAGTLKSQYQTNINLCAQCHNHRGASWASSSRPPHHSPQYNMLLGTVGELGPGVPAKQIAAHAHINKQCVACHMPTAPFASPSQPAVTGHSFQVKSFDLCRSCHPLPELLVHFTSGAISNQIQQVKAGLDYWATNQAPAALASRYGTRAWEYSTPGDLSPGGPGPNATEQSQIPDGIKKARYNLYIVRNDGSYGVHNGPHAIALLDAALDWIDDELDK